MKRYNSVMTTIPQSNQSDPICTAFLCHTDRSGPFRTCNSSEHHRVCGSTRWESDPRTLIWTGHGFLSGGVSRDHDRSQATHQVTSQPGNPKIEPGKASRSDRIATASAERARYWLSSMTKSSSPPWTSPKYFARCLSTRRSSISE